MFSIFKNFGKSKRFYSVFTVKDFNYPIYNPSKISSDNKELYTRFINYEKQYHHSLRSYCDDYLYSKIHHKLKDPQILKIIDPKFTTDIYLLKLENNSCFENQM